jgi:hypothetical protein
MTRDWKVVRALDELAMEHSDGELALATVYLRAVRGDQAAEADAPSAPEPKDHLAVCYASALTSALDVSRRTMGRISESVGDHQSKRLGALSALRFLRSEVSMLHDALGAALEDLDGIEGIDPEARR